MIFIVFCGALGIAWYIDNLNANTTVQKVSITDYEEQNRNLIEQMNKSNHLNSEMTEELLNMRQQFRNKSFELLNLRLRYGDMEHALDAKNQDIIHKNEEFKLLNHTIIELKALLKNLTEARATKNTQQCIGYHPDPPDDIIDDIHLKLMSFNVRNELLDKDDIDKTKHWELRRKVAQKLLNDNQYDVIGTQEGTRSQIRDIYDDLGYHKYDYYGLGRLPSKWYGSYRDHDNEHCAIFWKCNKLQIFDYGTFWLSDEPNKMGTNYEGHLPRIATWTIFDITSNDKYQLLFVSTHLGFPEDIRTKQLQWILKFIEEIIKENIKELLVFVVGDFNEALHGLLWNQTFIADHDQISSNNSLTDCIVDFEEMNNRTLNVNFTYHAYEGLQHAENDKNHAPIDWILCSKNIFANDDVVLRNVTVITDSMRIEEDIVYPSDHFPVVLDLDLTSKT